MVDLLVSYSSGSGTAHSMTYDGSGNPIIYYNSDTYTYDSSGNITRITDQSGNVTRYTYDKLGQLTREDNPYLGKTYVYAYDKAGNRTSKTTYDYTTGSLGTDYTQVNYSYDDGAWGDQLTGTTYDAIGNPDYYNGYDLTWDGRQLMEMSMNAGQFKYSFTYNDQGLRTSKTSGGVTHNYVWEGSKIVSESFGNYLLIYLYDESGSPIGLQYRTKTYAEGVFDTYYFEKNLFGDIIAVYNSSGTRIGSYTYDAWGNCTVSLESSATTAEKRIVRNFNPFRYRGYYYDYDTGLYYLQSRYYVPQWGRFLNADGYVSTGTGLLGYNMYAYCNNNPVMNVDYTGHSWEDFWDVLNTAVGLLFERNVVENVSIGVSVVSAVLSGRGGELIDDFKIGALNPFNQDESIALKTKVLGFYKGETVIRHSIDNLSSWQIMGVIYLNTEVVDDQYGYDTINHEWGHGVQERSMAIGSYLIGVALPSVINCQFGRYKNYRNKNDSDRIYYSKIWERTADFFGGVSSRTYDPIWNINNYLPW